MSGLCPGGRSFFDNQWVAEFSLGFQRSRQRFYWGARKCGSLLLQQNELHERPSYACAVALFLRLTPSAAFQTANVTSYACAVALFLRRCALIPCRANSLSQLCLRSGFVSATSRPRDRSARSEPQLCLRSGFVSATMWNSGNQESEGIPAMPAQWLCFCDSVGTPVPAQPTPSQLCLRSGFVSATSRRGSTCQRATFQLCLRSGFVSATKDRNSGFIGFYQLCLRSGFVSATIEKLLG